MQLLTGIRHVIHAIGFALLGIFGNIKTKYTISCYPSKPWPVYTLWNMAKVCGFNLKNGKSHNNGITMLFKDRTQIDKAILLPDASTWINGRCLDIRKSTVAKLFTEISHRSLLVNPREYKGPMVQKSEKNGTHSGKIICASITKKLANYVYERLIDNETNNENEIKDMKVVIVGSQIPLIYEIYRDKNKRFKSYGRNTKIASADDLLSKNEQKEIFTIANKIGLDFGEMDVLRDKVNSHIYIVDINKTTVSPPADLTFAERTKALRIIGRAFEQEFLV